MIQGTGFGAASVASQRWMGAAATDVTVGSPPGSATAATAARLTALSSFLGSSEKAIATVRYFAPSIIYTSHSHSHFLLSLLRSNAFRGCVGRSLRVCASRGEVPVPSSSRAGQATGGGWTRCKQPFYLCRYVGHQPIDSHAPTSNRLRRCVCVSLSLSV